MPNLHKPRTKSSGEKHMGIRMSKGHLFIRLVFQIPMKRDVYTLTSWIRMKLRLLMLAPHMVEGDFLVSQRVHPHLLINLEI